MIHKGDKFKVHWVGHESNYVDRVYEVVGIVDDCHCSRPSWHDNGLHWFNDIDPQTLHSIINPNFWLEIVRQPGDQLSLF